MTTNYISVHARAELDKRWIDCGGVKINTHMTDHPSVRDMSNSFMSLPIKERMQWVSCNVLPKLSTQVHTSHVQQMLQAVGAEGLYPHADKLDIFRIRSVGGSAIRPKHGIRVGVGC